ncbi:MAG TPA: ROK family protein [Terriglobales bacterium]|jgi:glucokinase|nr:ROK family protein [Terriglobales bacterium]
MTQVYTQNQFIIGVDIGGTKIAVGLVDSEGEIKSQARAPMVSDRGAATGLAAVTSAIQLISSGIADKPISIGGIGICAPGPLDPKTGIVVNPPNVPCWRNFPLAEEVGKIYRLPVNIDNDANAAALAEVYWGAGQGYRNVFYTTIGTGIGTGIVYDRRIYHGRTGAAGEGGHMSIDYRGPRCGCGKPGCIEALAAGPAIARRAQTKLTDHGSHSAILDLANGNIADVSSEMVGQAYSAGDCMAKEVLMETVELLSIWLSNVVDMLDPEVVIIGGGVAAMLCPLFDEIRSRLPRYCINSRCQEIPLLKARYGADAGIAGGAALCSTALA